MKALNNIILPDGMIWVNQYHQSIVQEEAWTGDGTHILWKGPQIAGNPVRLEAMEGQCWIPQATVQAIAELVYEDLIVLTWFNSTYNCTMFSKDGIMYQFNEVLPNRGVYTGHINLVLI